jgi:arginine utilization protein RocB
MSAKAVKSDKHNITNIIAIKRQKAKLSPKVPNGVVILSHSDIVAIDKKNFLEKNRYLASCSLGGKV